MKNAASFLRVIKRIRPYYGLLLLALLFAVLSVSLTLLIPVLVGRAIDNIIAEGQVYFEAVLQIIVLIAIALVGVSVFRWLMNWLINLISFRAVRDMRRDVFRKINSVPLSYIDSHPHGDLISRVINDIDAVGDGLTQIFIQLFSGVVTIIGTLIFMLMINPLIALAVVVLTPLSLFVAAFIGKLMHRRFTEQQLLNGDISAYVNEHVGNQQLVKAFSYEDEAAGEFDELNQRLFTVGFKAQFAGALANPSTRFVNAMVYAAVGIFGAISAISGVLTVGQLSAFLTYANQYTKPFNEVTGVLTQLQTAFAASDRVFEVLDAENEPDDSRSGSAPKPCRGEVKIDDISFSYSPDKPLIKNFSLNVKSGSEIKRDELRKSFGMVLQESWLFNGTIMENLRYGAPDATDEQVKKAARSAHAHSFIRRMPQGYDTVIGEEGSNLSLGQRQLLCIARAMLTDPGVLILDEATSSIDTLTEIRVQKAFAKMMRGRTSFVVAHRLSTIKESDVILVMRDGNIVEQGTHNELLNKKGFYFELYNSQFTKS